MYQQMRKPFFVGAGVLVGLDLVCEVVEKALKVLNLVFLFVSLVNSLPQRSRELLDLTLILLLAVL